MQASQININILRYVTLIRISLVLRKEKKKHPQLRETSLSTLATNHEHVHATNQRTKCLFTFFRDRKCFPLRTRALQRKFFRVL